jgi:hypothetical protein
MNSKDHFFGTRVVTALASGARNSAAVQTGAAIDISNAKSIALVHEVSAFSDGTAGIQDVQFADDSSFTQNVVTITSDDILMKNDRSSSTSAIAQTVLAATGRRKLSLENRAVNEQKYMRVRGVTVVGDSAVSLTNNIIALIEERTAPVVQA